MAGYDAHLSDGADALTVSQGDAPAGTAPTNAPTFGVDRATLYRLRAEESE
jgi:hypothetical protein